MAIVTKEIKTSTHTYLMSFSDDFRGKGYGYPHDTEILAVDGQEINEDESVSYAMHMEKDEFMEVIEAILDAVPDRRL